MTYNFDPDRWYRNELAMLKQKLKSETITQQEYDRAVARLDLRYDEMVRKLDGTYRIPE